MKPAIPDAAARQYTGGPSPVPHWGGRRNDRAGKPGLCDVEARIASLLDRSMQELRLAWHKLHSTEPPFGISRDLLIRSLTFELQQRAHGNDETYCGHFLLRRLDFTPQKLSIELDRPRDNLVSVTFAMAATEFAEASEVVKIISGEIEPP